MSDLVLVGFALVCFVLAVLGVVWLEWKHHRRMVSEWEDEDLFGDGDE